MSPLSLFIYHVGSSTRNFLIHYSNMFIYIFMCTDAGMHITLTFLSSWFLRKFCTSSEVTVNTLGKQGLRVNKGCMQGVPLFFMLRKITMFMRTFTQTRLAGHEFSLALAIYWLPGRCARTGTESCGTVGPFALTSFGPWRK